MADFKCYQPECLCECKREHKDEHLEHCISNGKCTLKHKSDCKITPGKPTELMASHIPSGYGFCVVSEYEEVYKTHYESHTFDGDVPKDFIKN